MDPLEFEDIKEIFLQFKSLHKNIHEFTSKKSNIQGLSADQCYLLGLIDHFGHPNQKILAELCILQKKEIKKLKVVKMV